MCSIYPRKTKSRTFGSCEATWDEVSASVVTAQRQTRAVYEVLRTTRVPHMLTPVARGCAGCKHAVRLRPRRRATEWREGRGEGVGQPKIGHGAPLVDNRVLDAPLRSADKQHRRSLSVREHDAKFIIVNRHQTAPSSRARQRGKGAALKSPRPGHCRRHGRACGQDGALRQPTPRTLVLAYSSTLERWEVSRIVGPPPHVTLPIISSPLWAHSDRRVGAGD
ncbi:unnamed protein product [Lampetra planeri]